MREELDPESDAVVADVPPEAAGVVACVAAFEVTEEDVFDEDVPPLPCCTAAASAARVRGPATP